MGKAATNRKFNGVSLAELCPFVGYCCYIAHSKLISEMLSKLGKAQNQ